MSNEIRGTFGGESENIAVTRATGNLFSIQSKTLETAQSLVTRKDMKGKVPSQGYDSSRHLPEIGVGVWSSLLNSASALRESVTALANTLQTEGATLLSISHHPTAGIRESYEEGVLPKPLYDILRGTLEGEPHVHPDVLPKVYAGWDNPERARGWFHEVGTMAASAQPWNSVDKETAASQIRAVQATGWLFNLLTANSPYAEGKETGKRDYRLEMWGPNGIMSTSRHAEDRNLTENIPTDFTSLTGYYKYVLGNQRPMVVPTQVANGNAGEYKTKTRAVVQPNTEHFNALDYLKSDTVQVVDMETGEKQKIKPSVAHICNAYDFLYFPRYGARLRLFLPNADEIDPKKFAEAVENGDDITFQKLLVQGGINEKGGALCVEGRVAATVLPTEVHQSWDRFNLPFVLQTGIVRAHEAINGYFDKNEFSWYELSHILPDNTNRAAKDGGFDATVNTLDGKKIPVDQVATDVWNIAKKTLTKEELELVGDEIDRMISNKQGPAEEQMEFVNKQVQDTMSLAQALLGLITHQEIYLN